MLGNKPDAGRTIDYQPRLPINRNGFRGLNYRYSTKADENGHFALERVLPGSGTVSRAVSIQENQNMWMEVPAWQTPIEVKANETARVTIGGTGRPVAGQFKTDRKPDCADRLAAELTGGDFA